MSKNQLRLKARRTEALAELVVIWTMVEVVEWQSGKLTQPHLSRASKLS